MTRALGLWITVLAFGRCARVQGGSFTRHGIGTTVLGEFVLRWPARRRLARVTMSAIDAVDGSPPPCGYSRWARAGGVEMGDVTTIGLDIGKSVFQVHGIDAVAR
jgi:hypothetical protein